MNFKDNFLILGTNENEMIPFEKMNHIPVFAEKVKVGDCLYVLSKEQKHIFEQRRVQKIDIVEETGSKLSETKYELQGGPKNATHISYHTPFYVFEKALGVDFTRKQLFHQTFYSLFYLY